MATEVHTKRGVALVAQSARAFLEAIRAGEILELRREHLYQRLAEIVFSYWAARMRHPQSLYDRKREKRIVARLSEGHGDWGILCYAVDGARCDDFLMGREDRSTRKYDGIETIFRDRSQVERLADLCAGYRGGRLHPLVLKYGPHAEQR